MRKLILAALCGFAIAVLEQCIAPYAIAGSPGSGPDIQTSGDYLGPVVIGSQITRPANATQYNANSIICASMTVACVPFTLNVYAGNSGSGLMNRVGLLKSGSATTSANFTEWFFNAPPTLTVNGNALVDGTAYAGPFAADILAGHYLGSATCTTTNNTSDLGTALQIYYECALSNPNAAGWTQFAAAPNGQRTMYGVLSVTAAYTPISGEVFTPYVSGIY